jgi:hypothetical protein
MSDLFCKYNFLNKSDVEFMRSIDSRIELNRYLIRNYDPLIRDMLQLHPPELHDHMRHILADFIGSYTAHLLAKLADSLKVAAGIEIAFNFLNLTFAQHLDEKKSLTLLCNLLNNHSGRDPPKRILLFTLEDVKLISVYFIDHFFKHFQLYCKTFATKLLASYAWGTVITGRFPHTLDLEYAKPVEDPKSIQCLKKLYFKEDEDDELNNLDLEDLMKGK